MFFNLHVNPMHLDPIKGPEPRPLTPGLGWSRPRIRKTGSDWECSIVAYMYHGDAVVVRARHADLNWAWAIMCDNLIRHNIEPRFADTKGPSYEEKTE